MNAPAEDPLRGLPGALLRRPRPDRRLRPLHERGRPHRPHRPADRARPHAGRRPPDRALRHRRLGRHASARFPTGIGAGTTYPDYKPAPFIVSREVEGADVVTVVTEAIFSYCGAKVKIDTDRHLGPEAATVRADGEAIGHVTTAEYGSQMLVARRRRPPDRRLQGRGQRHPATPCSRSARAQPVELAIDGGASLTVAAGRPPVVDGVTRDPDARRLRLGGDRHVRQPVGGPRRRGRRRRRRHHRRRLRAPGRPRPRLAPYRHPHPRPPLDPRPLLPRRRPRPRLGRHHASPTPLAILAPFEARRGARPGLTLLMVSTTGEDHAYYELDADLVPRRRDLPDRARPHHRAHRRELRACARLGALRRRRRRLAARRRHRRTRCGSPAPSTPRRRASPAAAPRSGSGPAAASPSWSTSPQVPDGAFGSVPTPAIVAPARVHHAARRLPRARRPRRRDPQPRRRARRRRRVRRRPHLVLR